MIGKPVEGRQHADRVADVMTPEPFTVRDSTNLEAAARILLRLKVVVFFKLWYHVCVVAAMYVLWR